MSSSEIYGLISILLTILFGLIGLFYIRKHKNPGKITFVKILSIGLLSDLIKSFKDISISYHKTPIKENLFLLRACIFNDGRIDIDEQMVKKQLSLVLSDGFQWVDINIFDKSQDLKCSFSIENNSKSLIWDIGLFKIEEYISFEALIEAPMTYKNSETIADKIGFDYRISNCSVRKKVFPNNRSLQELMYIAGFMLILPLAIIVLSIINPFSFQSHKIYFNDSNNKVYKIYKYSSNSVTLRELETNKKIYLDKNEFESSNIYTPKIPERVDLKLYIPIMIFFILFTVFGLFFIYREWKSYKLYTRGLKQIGYFTDINK